MSMVKRIETCCGKSGTHVVMVVNFCNFGNRCCALHNSDSLVVISATRCACDKPRIYEERRNKCDAPLANFHLSPLTPDLSKIVNSFEGYLSSLLQDLAGVIEIRFCLAIRPAFLVEFGKVDIDPM